MLTNIRTFVRRELLCLVVLLAGAANAAEQPPTLTDRLGAAAHSRCPASTARPTPTRVSRRPTSSCIIFTCPHCPTAQAYQERIKKLVVDYTPKNVTLVAINPNHADAVRLDELAYTDLVGLLRGNAGARETGEIQLRLARRRPEAGAVAQDGPGGDAARLHLRQGAQAALRRAHRRFRARVRSPPSSTRAMRWMRCVAGKEPPVTTTRVFGCSVKWADKVRRIREVQGALGRGAGDAREGRRRRRSRRSAKTRTPASCASSTCGRPGADPASPSSTSWSSTTCASATGRSRW